MKAFSIVLLFIGMLLIVFGWLFRIMHWPGQLAALFAGTVIAAAGAIVLIRSLKRENKDQA